MAAAYDTYNYPSYWEGRDYEHESEIIAIKDLLGNIEKIDRVLELGAGYGRLTPSYMYRAKKIILSDPSSKLLKIARENFKDQKNISYIHSSLENIDNQLRNKAVDLILLVRVLHHLDDCCNAFETVNKLLKDGGYFMLEFANKRHLKATFSQFIKGDLTFPIDIFPKDIRSEKHKKQKTLPFVNYHPDDITKKLEEAGFKIIEKRSVSNIRSRTIKRMLPLDTLLSVESGLQKPLSNINFGPSIFVLSQKV
jgi:ubiquinone/menaquinone biosynthesis C-methylase UbiE